MKRLPIEISLLILPFLVLTPENIVRARPVDSQQEYQQLTKQAAIKQKGLFLKRGIGINEKLRIGATISPEDSIVLNGYRQLFGLDYDLDDSLKTIRFFKCNQPGCYTDNNVAIDELIGTVIRRFGSPLQEKSFKEKGDVFIAYEGVAFVIGPDGRVKEIYILPLPRRK